MELDILGVFVGQFRYLVVYIQDTAEDLGTVIVPVPG